MNTANPAIQISPLPKVGWQSLTQGHVLVFICLLIWTCVARLPFYGQTDKDEVFFSIIAARWLEGGLPYVASFDVKPPGTFLIFAICQWFAGQSLLTIKAMEIVFVAMGAYGLYDIVRTHGSQKAAIWVAALYPVYTLTLSGVDAVAMILQLPFIILAFRAALNTTATTSKHVLAQAFFAGLWIGAAGMIKQTAIFEAVAIGVMFVVYLRSRRLWAVLALFACGAAIPALGFGLYFLAIGHFQEMFNAVIVLAAQRAAPDVLAGYGPEAASEFTFVGTLKNAFLPSLPLAFLWGSALFCALRFRRVNEGLSKPLLVISVLWLGAALLEVMAGRGLCTYYLLGIVPPLLILAGGLFAHGIGDPKHDTKAVLTVGFIFAIATMAVIDRRNLFTPDPFLAGDYVGEDRVATRLLALGLTAQDHLLVVNRGYRIYLKTGAQPASPYFHATHLLSVFHTPAADPLKVALEARPAFIVLADPAYRHISEQPKRFARINAFLNAHYNATGVVTGSKDRFFIYRYRAG